VRRRAGRGAILGRPDFPGGDSVTAKAFQIDRLVRQSALLLTSGAVSYVGAFVLNVVLARSLGVAAFGAWAIAFSVTLTLSTAALVGSDWIVVRNGAYLESVNDHVRLRRLIHIALVLGGVSLAITACALILLAPALARNVFHNGSLEPLLRLAGFTVPVLGLQQIMLSGTRAFKSVTELVLINNLAQPLVRVLAVGFALLVVPSATSAFTGLLVAELVLAALAVVALNRRIPLLGPTRTVSIRETMNFALPAWGTRLAENLRKEMFPLLLGSLSGFTASGLYVASKRVSSAPSSVINSLLRVYTPIASDLYLQNRRDELVVLFQNLGKWSFALAFPLSCFLVAFPTEILSLFGSAFVDARPVLVVLAVGMLFVFGTGPVTVTLIISGRPKLALADYVVAIAAEVGIALWLIPQVGVVGAAVAKLVGAAVNNVVPLIQVWRLAGVHPYRLDYWKPVAAGLGALGIAKGVLTLAPLGYGVVAAMTAALVLSISYVLLLLMFGLSEEDRVAVSTLFRRNNVVAAPSERAVDMPPTE
jgi:O-antigen/teichoic acid export membrane protein